MADFKHNYIWTIKNCTKSPVFINDLPPNGLMVMHNEHMNLHDRYSLYVVENSKSLRNALDLGFVKTLRKEIYSDSTLRVNNLNGNNSDGQESNNLKNELEELKSLIKNSMINKQESISKDELIKILEINKNTQVVNQNIDITELSDIVKKTVLETMGNGINIKPEEEIKRRNYDNLDIATDFILNSKNMKNNIETNLLRNVDEKVIKDNGLDDLDQLANLLE